MPVHTRNNAWQQRRGIQRISLYVTTQHAKGLLNDISHAEIGHNVRRIGYETYWKTHKEVILPEVKRLAMEYKLRLEMSVGAYDSAGRWIYPQVEPNVPDYVGILLIVRPAIDLTLLHERKNS